MTITMPTKVIPTNPENLSPALAAMIAVIITPNQYSRFVGVAVSTVNAKCKSTVKYIGK
jgi:hypothetical protein